MLTLLVPCAFFEWNPSRIALQLPILDIDLYWYSLFFAVGLIGGYSIASYLLVQTHPLSQSEREQLSDWFDRLIIWIFIGILIGARLGHILFYDFEHFFNHPEEIVKTWKGGLASHGGITGLLIAAYLYWKRTPPPVDIPWKHFLDIASIASAWAATSIRIGNFFNQEIIGYPTDRPWAVKFLNPMDSFSMQGIACHPVQLYEAIVSFILLVCLFILYRIHTNIRPGLISGIYLTTLFTSRIILETFKLPQGNLDSPYMQMGQLLSIPFIGFGIYLFITSFSAHKRV